MDRSLHILIPFLFACNCFAQNPAAMRVTTPLFSEPDYRERAYIEASDDADRLVERLEAGDRDIIRYRVVVFDWTAAWQFFETARGNMPQLPVRYLDVSMFPDATCTLTASLIRKRPESFQSSWFVTNGCIESGGVSGVTANFDESDGKVRIRQSRLGGAEFVFVPLENEYGVIYERRLPITSRDNDVAVVKVERQ